MKNKSLLDCKSVHFIGIGGIGMSGIAKVMLEMGYSVSGSDAELNSITEKLSNAGARISCGHRPSNIPTNTQIVVYSTSINKTNPEIREAKRLGIPIVHRACLLGEIFNSKIGIAVTGTHGKTTTTSLVSVMLNNLGADPTAIIGGEVSGLKSNAKLGKGEHCVVEADESDSSFLHLKPHTAVITNIENEHLDHFEDLQSINKAFSLFAGNIKKGGTLYYNCDDKNLSKVAAAYRGKKNAFGLSSKADIRAENIRLNGFGSSFDCFRRNKKLGRVNLKIPGVHNVVNALAAISVGLGLGFKFADIARSVKDFEGAKRRFQLRADVDDVILIDDYAHHPTEIRAVLDASMFLERKRRIVVFQPHRYSRTQFFAKEFGGSFCAADKLILTEIFAASEKPIKGVTSKLMYDYAVACGMKDVEIIKKDDISDYIMRIKRPGDLIIVMGAGDIKKVADKLTEKLLTYKKADKEAISHIKGLVKGRIRLNEPLSARTSFKIGGKADIWVEPHDEDDLRKVLEYASGAGIKFAVIGNGTNILAGDEGFHGVIAHLNSLNFKQIHFNGCCVRVGAGFALPLLVKMTCEKGLSGIESLVGIPGTVGGAVYMNAGGWANPVFKNIGESVESVKVMRRDGKVEIINRGDLNFGYRSSNIGDNIILEAVLKLVKSSKDKLVSSSAHFLMMKKEKQALDVPSAGCIFKNPADFQFTSGQMIDMLGLKGKRIGGAEISSKHANFIINRGGATSKDVLKLAGLVKERVKDNYGIELEMEIGVL